MLNSLVITDLTYLLQKGFEFIHHKWKEREVMFPEYLKCAELCANNQNN